MRTRAIVASHVQSLIESLITNKANISELVSTSTWLEQIVDALRPPWNLKRPRADAAHDDTSDDTLQHTAPAAAAEHTARHSPNVHANGHANNAHAHHQGAAAAAGPVPRRPARRLPPWYRRAPLWRIVMYVIALPWKLLFALVPPTGTCARGLGLEVVEVLWRTGRRRSVVYVYV